MISCLWGFIPFFLSYYFKSLYEEVNLKEYETFEEAKMALFEFIEGWYNRKRIHSAIGYQIPYDIEKMSA